jgi:hypothetical protein
MGLMSRARVLGYRSAPREGGGTYLFLPAWKRRKVRKVVPMGVYTSRHGSGPFVPLEGRFSASDPEFLGKFPALFEFLAEVFTEEGVPRITSTLLVSCEDGVWKLALTDRASAGGKFDYKLWVSGQTLFEALASLDKQLRDSGADWRKFPKWEKPGRR